MAILIRQLILREKGAASAVKKQSKVAAEGLIKLHVNEDKTKGALVEVNSQTDFVAKNENFVKLMTNFTPCYLNNNISSVEELNKSKN